MGYTTQAIEANHYYLVAAQFKDVGQSAETITLDKLIKLSNVPATTFADATKGLGVQIQVLKATGSGYTTYYYVSNPKNASGVTVEGPAWVSTLGKIVTVDFDLGTGFWFKAATVDTDATATFAGEVKSDNFQKTVDLREGYNMIANTYPVAINGVNVTVGGITPTTFADATKGLGIQIQVLKASGSGYTTYYYVSNPKDASGAVVTGPAWVTTLGKMPTTAIAGVGEGFWLKAPSSGTLTFDINPNE